MISVDRLTTAQRRAIFAAQDRMVQAHPKTLQALMGFELVQRYHDHREQIPTKYQLTIQGQQIQNALRLMHQIDYHNPHLQKIVDQLSPEQRSTLLLINCEGMGLHLGRFRSSLQTYQGQPRGNRQRQTHPHRQARKTPPPGARKRQTHLQKQCG